MAKQAHAEDNAPGVERALARMEATLIHLDPQTERTFVRAPKERFATEGAPALLYDGAAKPAEQGAAALLDEDDIPFVDLSSAADEEQ